jgi:hypothetical protein
MVTRDEVMSMLLAACPSFGEAWRKYVGDPAYEAGLLYIDLGEFAHHLVRLQKAGESSEIESVFRVVEVLHTDRGASVREAATIGLLEGIQDIAGSNNLDPESFYPYLQPESATRWGKVNTFWNGDVKALSE